MPHHTQTQESRSKLGARKGSAKVPEEVIQTSFRLPRSRWARLQTLSIDERATVQSIVVAALEAEFARRGLPF